jgi:predicted membrane metal-binding protein
LRGSLHENFEANTGDGPGSERGFAIVFALVFVLFGLWPAIGGGPPRAWSLLVAAVLLIAGFLAPGLLAPFNRLWFRFGLLLGRIVSPVVLAVLFFATVLPTGLMMRLFGKDILRLRLDREAESYWIPRDPPGPEPESLRRQF